MRSKKVLKRLPKTLETPQQRKNSTFKIHF